MQAIRKEIVVEASQQTAFNVFTRKMDLWWPKTHHVGKTPAIEAILEAGERGRWYTRHEDGSEVNVGYVQTWDPYGRLVLVWQIDGNFQCDPDLISEIEITFTATGPKTTFVQFEHRDLQKLMGGAKVIADMDHGWGYILSLYKSVSDQEERTLVGAA